MPIKRLPISPGNPNFEHAALDLPDFERGICLRETQPRRPCDWLAKSDGDNSASRHIVVTAARFTDEESPFPWNWGSDRNTEDGKTVSYGGGRIANSRSASRRWTRFAGVMKLSTYQAACFRASTIH